MNYVIIANIEWGFLKQRHQYIAENLHENGHNVIFVESSAKRNPKLEDIPRIISRVWKLVYKSKPSGKTTKIITPYVEGIHVISPVVFPSTNKFFRFLNKNFLINYLVRSIESKLVKKDPIHIVNYLPSTTSMEIIRRIKPDKLIYDCVSNFEGIKTMPKDTAKIENELLELADYTYVDCDFLFEKHKEKAKRIYQLEPGVNFELFNSISETRILNAQINKILYYGHVSDRIDFDLLSQLVESGFEITLVGLIQRNIRIPSGVNIIPAVTIDELPDIIRKFDALIIPYVLNEYTIGIIPAKFFECFATGLPVIVTKQYNYNKYEPLLLTGETHQDIINNIRGIDLDSDRKTTSLERIKIAKEHTWKNFIKQFLSYGNVEATTDTNYPPGE